MRHTQAAEIEAVGTRPLSELAYELIVDKIIRLELPPGVSLVEKKLMDELEFGRTPVREALQRLTIEGLVCRTYYRGVYVCEVTTDSIERVAEFREMTDPTIARYAAERAMEPKVSELDQCVEQMRGFVLTARFDEYIRSSRKYYTKLASLTNNIHLEETAKHVYNFDARLLYFSAPSSEDRLKLARARLDNAETIADCIRRRAGREAEAATRLYLLRYFENIIAILR